MNEIRLESVSIGKGFVRWRVVTPRLKKRPRDLEEDYEDLTSACEVVKALFLEQEVDPDTVALVEERDPDGTWGSARG